MSHCTSETCQMHAHAPAHASARPECHCGKEMKHDCCPVEAAANKWKEAFCTAKKEVMVDLLKEKIQKEWGAKMDKIAEATVKAMGLHLESVLTQAQAKKDLRESIHDIFQSAHK